MNIPDLKLHPHTRTWYDHASFVYRDTTGHALYDGKNKHGVVLVRPGVVPKLVEHFNGSVAQELYDPDTGSLRDPPPGCSVDIRDGITFEHGRRKYRVLFPLPDVNPAIV